MRLPLVLLGILPLAAGGAEPLDAPSNLRCEWQASPASVPDPCPDFYWQATSQRAYRVQVADNAADLAGNRNLVWDSGRVETRLPVAEYAGPPLGDGRPYFWTVQVWDATGRALAEPPAQSFRLAVRPRPHHLPTIRTFINFAGEPAFARDWLDLSFRREAKQGRPDIVTLHYALICTLVLPHPSTRRPLEEKAAALADFCAAKGLSPSGIAEEMFCHFAEDTYVTLHAGAERASNPLERRLCPGWDPANDRNGDGRVDDDESARLANPKATAREPKQARIPIYFWGPPQDDFVMNVGHAGYQEFMASVWAPRMCEDYDGIYFDTVPTDVAGAGRGAAVREYPPRERNQGRWVQDLQMLFARIKLALPDKIVTGNAWNAMPMVNDGRQNEGWESIGRDRGLWRGQLDQAIELDRRGKVQLIQYNPVFDAELAEFGAKLPVSQDRDRLFGLATYLLAHGRFTYFGFGVHPYANVTRLWFPAMRCDLGEPEGPYWLFAELDPARAAGENLLANGDFEQSDGQGEPQGWQIAEPVQLDSAVKHGGRSSARITSSGREINNINRLVVHLKPNTTYTLIAWVKTDNVAGEPGAQVYPYDFAGAAASGMLTWDGTHDWTEQRLVLRTGDDGEGRINFRVYGASGTAWFDDLRLVEGTAVSQEVYARRYTKGLVLVKPYAGGSFGDETATVHRLPGEYRVLRADGTAGPPVREVTLRSGEAAILTSPSER